MRTGILNSLPFDRLGILNCVHLLKAQLKESTLSDKTTEQKFVVRNLMARLEFVVISFNIYCLEFCGQHDERVLF